jgi:hypothetical protein
MTGISPVLDTAPQQERLRSPGLGEAGSDERIGWGGAAAIGVLLAVVFPILFARPTLQSFSRLPVVLAWVVTVYSAGRLWYLVTRGRESIVSLTFWLFIYVWLGLGALANTVSQQFPLFHQTFSDGTEVGALITIVIGLAGYELGRVRSRSRQAALRASAILNAPTVKMRRVAVLGGLGCLVVAYYTLKFGLATRFTSREASAQAFFGTPTTNVPLWLQNDKASALIQISLDWVLVFVALYLILYERRIRRTQRRDEPAGPRRRVLLFAVIACVVLADNPFSNPRYRFGGVALALLFALWPLTNRRFRLVAAGLVVSALFIYPYAAVFRYNRTILTLAPLNQQFRTDADFGMFQQELNAQTFVQRHGIQYGRQLEGVVFAWVPRRIWASKPGFTGSLILGQFASILPASVSMFGWAYVDGGLPWVFIVLLVYGFLSGALEQAWLRRPRDRLTFAATATPLFAAFQIFLVRGDLQPAVGELAPVFIALASVCVYGRRARAVSSRISA